MPRLRVSLANKCQLAFGAAVIVIVVAALSVPWLRMQALVNEGQREIARSLADAWLRDLVQLGGSFTPPDETGEPDAPERSLRIALVEEAGLDAAAARDSFVDDAVKEFYAFPKQEDAFSTARDADGNRIYRYARAIRQDELDPARDDFAADIPATQVANPLRAVLLIDLRAQWADDQVRLNRIWVAVAGGLASVLAIAVFWFILTRVILSPVRVLRDTAEKVTEGDLQIRADINTGDEFEQLSNTFNAMLTSMKIDQDKLRDLNKQLDLKLGELAESNVTLYEANRIKGDFLANVSHELRTPLNSIIGFAEVLAESLTNLGEDEANTKRVRYASNIHESSRSLLVMIEELLDLAKIEAGRVDLHIEKLSIADTCETLLNLIRPQAEKKQIKLELVTARDLPSVTTDPGKLQQIVFNFLSNAVKFTPVEGRIELGAAAAIGTGGKPTGVRIWVTDSGPGIPREQHESVFDKFRQLDSTHTREHGGAGLGLAISRELATMLDAEITLDSDIDRGATFSLTIPHELREKKTPLMPDAT